MILFKEPIKPCLRQIKPNESDFRFLQKSTIEFARITRDRLNSYFSNVVAGSKKGLKSRFNQDFTSAYFELLIHQLFFNNGFSIEEHPDIPNTVKKPDYLVMKGYDELYVECKEFKDLSDEQRKIEKVKKELLYELSRMRSPYYSYNIEMLEITTPELPDLSLLYNELNKVLQVEPVLFTARESSEFYKIEYCNENIYIRLNLTLRYNWEDKVNEDELLGWHVGNTRYDFSEDSLISGLKNKMLKYGITDKPLCITLNVNSFWFSKPHIFEKILYRSGVHVLDGLNGNYTRFTEDGLFFEHQDQIKHVLGVLVVFMASPYNDKAEFYFYKNPFYEYKEIESLKFLENTWYKNYSFTYDENNKKLFELTN